jgi:FtsZ-interacting cell division protein ZipA
MTDLQLALLALGALIIAAVVLFNWWQERNIRNETSKHLNTPQRDVLMDDFDRIAKPVLDADSHAWQTLPTSSEGFETDTELLDEAGLADMSAPYESHYAEPKMPASGKIHSEQSHDALPADISRQIDLTALLYLHRPVRGADLREFLLILASLDKPIYAYGQTFDGVWHMLTREQEEAEFKKAAYTLQLADRAGPVSKEMLHHFQQAVDEIGLVLNAQVEWQGNPDPLSYAQELDQFCVDVDKMINVHLTQGANGPFTGTKFRGLAEANGLKLGKDGAFHYTNESGHTLFSLVNHDNNPFDIEMLRTVVLRGVAFQLDIPRVKNCTEVFNQMILIAKKMEASLSCNLVDDNQRPLGEVQIEKIRQQLKVIHAQMLARGVVPGSPCALRLFA